jgi:tetratricopeptide (TPR) repeat protein
MDKKSQKLRATNYAEKIMLRPLSIAFAASFLLLAFTSSTVTAATPATAGLSDSVETHIKRGAPRVQDLEDIQAYVAKHPEDMHGRFVLGELLASGGYQELAAEQFDEIAKHDPQYVLHQFQELLQSHSFETARWLGFYVSKKWPDDSSVLYMMGRQAVIKGQNSRAKQYYEKALNSKPVWPELYQGVAQLAFAGSRRDEAIKFADKALQVNPNDETAKAIKAASQAELSGHPERYLAELKQYAPRNWSNDAVTTMLAQAYINTGDYDSAVQPALYALEYSQGARKLVAEQQLKLLMGKVKPTKMLADLNYISPLDTRDFMSTVLRLRFARCLSEFGAHQQASKILLEALNMNSFFAPQLNYRLAREYEAQNRPDDAVFFYKMAYQLKPDDQEYERAYKRAQMRYDNQQNDLARRLKQMFKPHSRT